MDIIFYVLTTLVIIDILIRARKRKFSLGKPVFRQSSIHNLIKDSLPLNSQSKSAKPSQSKLHNKKTTIKVVMAPDNKAYWVNQNVFYCADLHDGQFDPNTAIPVDIQNMSKTDLANMLLIIDMINETER